MTVSLETIRTISQGIGTHPKERKRTSDEGVDTVRIIGTEVYKMPKTAQKWVIKTEFPLRRTT